MADEHDQHGGGEHGGGGHGGGGHGHGGGHGGGGGHAEGEHEGAPEWLISFADNVALMMGFFVILLAMNMGPKGTPVQGGAPSDIENYDGSAAADRMLDFAIGVRSAFNNPVDPSNPADAALVKRMRERQAIGETTLPGPDGKKKDLSSIKSSSYVNINATIYFPESLDELSEEGDRTLARVAEDLRGRHHIIELRGHVSAAESKRDKARAMKLAYDRALAVATPLIDRGMRWEQLRLVACADNERAVPIAGSTAKHAENQRVEIVVTEEPVPPDPYTAPHTQPPDQPPPETDGSKPTASPDPHESKDKNPNAHH